MGTKWVPRLLAKFEGDRMRRCATGTAERRGLNRIPHRDRRTGHVRKGCTGTWDGVSAHLSRTGTERQDKSSRPGVERSERAIGAVTWGNLLQGTLPSKGARRRTESLEGTDDRVTELAGHLTQARANSEAGEGDPWCHPDAGALHRRELA